ncbi:hypothetical protein TrispH2_001919 [Trichoplax sp. H2]|nr:hypothetical protein TrispH2_001919 [Trichoplax sp. H2]|eukprot:RDD45990.1 hypothetical protein TrispH2_001919 [Trichoplax sp. H2]
MTNKQLHIALLEWINSTGVISSTVKHYQELQDGQILFNILKLFGEDTCKVNATENDNSPQSRYRAIFAYMEEFYQQPLKNIVSSKKIVVNCDTDEIMKVVTLLLSCAVHCNNVAIFINCITKLDNNVQLIIKSAIEHVSDLVETNELTSSLLENIKLNGNVDRMSILEDEYCLSSSPREPSFINMAYSPMIAKNFCSPHLANRQKQMKELQMERRIDTLKRQLKSHKGNEVEFESELNEKNKIIQEKELKIKELTKQVSELNLVKQQLDGIAMLQDHVDSKDCEIDKLRQRLHEMEGIRNGYNELENKVADLLADKDNLEDKLKATYRFDIENQNIQNQLDQAESAIDELRGKLTLADVTVSKLTQERNELLLAQEQTTELLKERTVQFEEQQKQLEEIAFKATETTGGMALTLEAHERLNHLECETNQLQTQLDEMKAIKDDVDLRNVQLESQLRDMLTCKETLEVKVKEANSQLDDAKHNIAAKQILIEEIHKQHSINIENINHQLQNEIEQRHQMKEAFNLKIEDYHAKEQELSNDLQNLQEKLDKSTSQMKMNIKELEQQLDQIKKAKVDMEEKYTLQLKQLQLEFNTKEEDNQRLAFSYQQQIRELDLMHSQLKGKYQYNEEKKQELQVKVNQLEKELDVAVKKYEKQLSQQQHLIKSMNDNLTEKDTNHQALLQNTEEKVMLANNEVQNLKMELKKDLNERIQQKDDIIASLKVEITALHDQYKKDNEQNQRILKEQLTKAEEEKDTELNQNQQIIAKNKKVIDQLQSKLTEIEVRYQKETDDLKKSLQKQVDQLKLSEKQWLKDQQELARQLSEEVALHQRYDNEIKQAHQCANDYRLKCNQLQNSLRSNAEEKCKLSSDIQELSKKLQDEQHNKCLTNDRVQELEKKLTQNDEDINQLKSQLILKDNNLAQLEKKATEYQDKLLQHIQKEQADTTTNNAILLSQSLQDIQSQYKEMRTKYEELKDNPEKVIPVNNDGRKSQFNIKEDELAKLYNKIRYLVRDNDLLSQGKHVAEIKLREEQKINNRLRGQVRSLDTQLKYIQDNPSSSLSQQQDHSKLKDDNDHDHVKMGSIKSLRTAATTIAVNTTNQSILDTSVLCSNRIQRDLNEYYSDDSLDDSVSHNRSLNSSIKSKLSNRKSITYIVNDIAAKLKENDNTKQQKQDLHQQEQSSIDDNEVQASRRLASTYIRGTSKGCLHTVGSLMTVDDEPEHFDWTRLGELNRRNQQNPSHLQSSYPIELQISNDTLITEEQIKHGSTLAAKTSVSNNNNHPNYGKQKRNATNELSHDESKRVRLRHRSRNLDALLSSNGNNAPTVLSSTTNENQAIEFKKPNRNQQDKTKSTSQNGYTNSAKKVTRSSHRAGSVLRKKLGILTPKTAKKVSHTNSSTASSKVLAERNSVV